MKYVLLWRPEVHAGSWNYSYWSSKTAMVVEMNDVKSRNPNAQFIVWQGRPCDVVSKTTYDVESI